jgi:NAD(P)-dependent dehydrogenase (short-subunit alcohol dehydrogenase family)
MGRKALPVPTDVTQEAQVQKMVEKALAEFGKIDILVNNAGTEFAKPLVPMPGLKTPGGGELASAPLSSEEWEGLMRTNLTSMFFCCKAVGPHMIQR